MTAKQKTKKPLTFPIYLDREDDSCAHMVWLADQETAVANFHKQVMQFLQPQMADLAVKRRKWWDRIIAKYEIPHGLEISLEALGSPMPRLVLAPKKPDSETTQ